VPHCDSLGGIPHFTNFTAAADFKAQDFTLDGIVDGSELPVLPDSVWPEAKEYICTSGWRISKRPICIDTPALDARGQSIQPLDLDSLTPTGLIVCPPAIKLEPINPQQLLAGSSIDAGSVFRGVLETRPLGRENLPCCPPTRTMESSLTAVLAPFPGWELVASTTWQSRATHFPFLVSMADWSSISMMPVDLLPFTSACIKVERVEKAALPRPWIAYTPYLPILWPEAKYAIFLSFLAEQSSFFTGVTILPPIAEVPDGRLKTAPVPPSLTWEGRHPAYKDAPAARFLPVRNGPILPQVRSWQRRDSSPPKICIRL
jgi:hypothetical protein